MKTLVNDEPLEVPEGATLADLVAQLRLDHRGIAIAVNAAVVAHSCYAEHRLREEDRIEIIHAVAGG
jgi:thiamine biosynthesis protein ThiS